MIAELAVTTQIAPVLLEQSDPSMLATLVEVLRERAAKAEVNRG